MKTGKIPSKSLLFYLVTNRIRRQPLAENESVCQTTTTLAIKFSVSFLL